MRQRAPEWVALLGAAIIGGQAWLGGVPTGLTLWMTLLTGAGLWVATRVAVTLHAEGRRGRGPGLAIFGGILLLTTTGLIIRAQGFGQSQAVLLSLLFWSGVIVGLGFGVYGTYAQTRTR